MSGKRADRPVLLGGPSILPQPLTIVRPLLPPLAAIQERLEQALQGGQLTNNGPYVRALEEALAAYFGVAHVVAVGNATAGLMILARALASEGEVILPSFTFSASAHALVWAGLRPAFADILPGTYTLDPAAVEHAINERTVAIMGVHIYGHPCEVNELQQVADRHGIPLFFDAAHATGSRYRGRPVGGNGLAEVFSFHATKIFPVGEGGAIATDDSALAEQLRLWRVFGCPPGEENTLLAGINGKMQEFNALIGLENLKSIDRHVAHRRALAAMIRSQLAALPGLRFQTQQPYAYSNYQNLSIQVDAEQFGLNRDELYLALRAENVHARKYFSPPLHRHDAYANLPNISGAALAVTEQIAGGILCLPLYSQMSEREASDLCLVLQRLHDFSPEIHAQLMSEQ